MDKDSSKEGHPAFQRGAGKRIGEGDAEESLSEALNGLEQILERRQQGGAAPSKPDEAEAELAPADAQYTIPLLHDVVVPGAEAMPDRIGDASNTDHFEPGVDEEEAQRKLAEKLANEIEVLVQARVETAVQEAAEDIREQIRNHLEIMLPEIIEELNALARRPRN